MDGTVGVLYLIDTPSHLAAFVNAPEPSYIAIVAQSLFALFVRCLAEWLEATHTPSATLRCPRCSLSAISAAPLSTMTARQRQHLHHLIVWRQTSTTDCRWQVTAMQGSHGMLSAAVTIASGITSLRGSTGSIFHPSHTSTTLPTSPLCLPYARSSNVSTVSEPYHAGLLQEQQHQRPGRQSVVRACCS